MKKKTGIVPMQVLMVMTVYLVLSLLLSGCASAPKTNEIADTALLIIDTDGTLIDVTHTIKLKGKLELPLEVKKIGKSAFKRCIRLTEVIFPPGLVEIDSNAFEGCTGLKSIDLTFTNITTIGDEAFKGCKSLTSVDLSECSKLTAIGGSAFESCKGLTQIRFPANLSSIGFRAFKRCKSLKNIDLSECVSLTRIASETFYRCWGLTEVRFPPCLTYIGPWAFYNCIGLTELYFPASLTTIDIEAFRLCAGLIAIYFPVSLTSIKFSAFEYCERLRIVDLSLCDKLTEIGGSAFGNIPNRISFLLPVPKTTVLNLLRKSGLE